MKLPLIFIATAIGFFPSNAQHDGELDFERLADEFSLIQDGEGNYEDVYENVVQVLASPHDLNRVSAEELQLLGVLTDPQIASFLRYREAQGPFIDVHELQAIPLFDEDDIARLLPYVQVIDPQGIVDKSLLQRIFSSGNSYFISRYERTIEQKKGFGFKGNAPSYLGSPDKIYTRFRTAQTGDYSIGFTGEKDAGEPFRLDRGGHPRGFDFTSFHVQLQEKGKVKNLVVGDFQAQFAQGLLLGGAFGAGKGSESVAMIRRSNVGFLPYTGVHESNFQRGAAVTLEPTPSFEISAFYSRMRRDAITKDDSLTVSSLPASGLHRTPAEIEARKTMPEERGGMVLHLKRSRIGGGIVIEGTRYGTALTEKPQLYNAFDFTGTQNLNTGAFLNYRYENLSFFAEVARTYGAGCGALGGILISAHPNLELAILYRDYHRNFHSFYANAFSENTRPQNERGMYWGWKYRWGRRFSATGYLDLFSFPWLTYRRHAPTRGSEWLVRTTYAPARNTSLFVQYREESKSRNLAEMSTLYRLAEGVKRNITLHCDFGVANRIRLRSRVQYNRYDIGKKATHGWALVQDVSVRTGPLRFTARHALFDTEDFDTRIYLYEHDVWLAYSLPAMSGVGVRNYLLIQFKAGKRVMFWCRYARTSMLKEDELGTGGETIEGNTRNDVKFQVRYRF